MRKLLLLMLGCCMTGFAFGQPYDTLTIQQIQFIDADSLADCNDTSPRLGDTVITYATVVMSAMVDDPQNPGGPQVPNAQAAGGRNVWIQSGTGPFSGVDLFTFGVPTPVPDVDVLDLQAGDSIQVTGIIGNFFNEKELIPIDIQLLDLGRPVHVNPIMDLGMINDNNQVNELETGEQWEGAYIELYNLTVTARSFFSGNNRVSLICSDDQGNLINVSDRFLAARLPASGGTFVPPPPGTKFDTLRGVLAHSGNGCTGGGGRGYELYPFQESDYIIGTSPPIISNETRNPITPGPTQDVNVFATIEDPDGNVDTASLYYAVGASNTNFLEVPMTATGNTYSATIPNAAFSEGDLVKYYISATDDSALTSTSPSLAANGPFFFAVRENGTTIYDVQFTPFDNGNSGYLGLEVTLTGVVTATAQPNDLGFVYIQQAGEDKWAGLSLVQDANLASLVRGDSIEVTGVIEEDFGLTRMAVSGVSVLKTGATIPDAVEVDPDIFTTYDFALNEAYECMLVKLKNPSDSIIYIVEENADGPNNNFAEYRVGSSNLTTDGARVLAGRVTGSAFSSLAFPYINDTTWLTESGIITVQPTCVVTAGDTMRSLTGIMYYSFGNMKLLPRNSDDADGYRGANCPQGVVGIEDELAGSKVVAYPNPTQNGLTVDYRFPIQARANIVLMDLMGRVVAAEEVRGVEGNVRFSTAALSNGTYVLMVYADNYIIAREKILIVK